MALANHGDLLAAIAAWMNRSDLTAQIPDFIVLAEAEFNRRLRILDMEKRADVTIISGVAPLPADSLGVREVLHAGRKLDAFNLPDINGQAPLSGVPAYYAISGGSLYFHPVPASGSATVLYYQKIPALTAASPINWLMTRAPDLYLMGCLMQAEFFGWNDERLPAIKGRVDEILAQIEAEAVKRKHGATPLLPRLRHAPTLNRKLRA